MAEKPKEDRIQWTGKETYRGADEESSTSLTCQPGDVVRVSPKKREELLAVDGWKPYEPRSTAATSGVPGEGGAAASSSEGDPNAVSSASADPTRSSSGSAGRSTDDDDDDEDDARTTSSRKKK